MLFDARSVLYIRVALTLLFKKFFDVTFTVESLNLYYILLQSGPTWQIDRGKACDMRYVVT